MDQFLLIALVVLAIIAASALIYYVYISSLYSKGLYGFNSVGSFLKRYSLSRNFKTLSNVIISDAKDSAKIDHVLVGFFGVLFVNVIQVKTELYGDIKEDLWSLSEGGKKVSIPNPVKISRENLEAFRSMLSRKKIYKVPMEQIVVIVGFGKPPALYLSNLGGTTPTMSISQMKKLLSNSRFSKDNDVDVDLIVSAINDLSQKSPK